MALSQYSQWPFKTEIQKTAHFGGWHWKCIFSSHAQTHFAHDSRLWWRHYSAQTNQSSPNGRIVFMGWERNHKWVQQRCGRSRLFQGLRLGEESRNSVVLCVTCHPTMHKINSYSRVARSTISRSPEGTGT